MIQAISDATGLGVPTLKLLLTLLGGYPTAYIYRSLFLRPIEGEDKGKTQRSIFLALSGLFWAYFYNGNDIIHSLICIAFTYAVCYIGVLTKQRLIANGLVFTFNLVYLLGGYVYNMQGDYDVSWTMPHCVLCLRLIGFGFDVMDGGEQLKALEKGAKKEKEVVPDAQKTAPPKAATAPRGVSKTPVSFSGNCSLVEMPSILETIGYCYFFSAFLIGPQFSFRLYNEFIQLKNLPVEKDGKLPSGANRAALKAFLLGAFYLGLQQVLTGSYPSSVFTSAEFDQKSFFSKLVFTWVYGRGAVSKVINFVYLL
jgi:lysophospholipid acyltransferase 5